MEEQGVVYKVHRISWEMKLTIVYNTNKTNDMLYIQDGLLCK